MTMHLSEFLIYLESSVDRMLIDKTRKAVHTHRTDEPENDCCSPDLDWQWILGAHVARCISWESSRSSHRSATFNIKV